MWLLMVGGIVAVFTVLSLWFARARKLDLKRWLGAAGLVGWVVFVLIKVHADRSWAADRAVAAIAWPATAGAALPVTEPTTAGQPKTGGEIGSVESLLGGLEKRLEHTPDDAEGWALLAQSYAFLGDSDRAEKAVSKAVALGVDESALRARVAQAQRSRSGSGLGG